MNDVYVVELLFTFTSILNGFMIFVLIYFIQVMVGFSFFAFGY